MNTVCPNCGAQISFRFDDSFVRICDYCRQAVLRTDRGLESLGRVADLMPIESPLRLFSTGNLGSASFLLVGMAQLRHPAGGIWQEWYAKLDGGRWGWLSEAQGRFYLMFAVDGATLPDYEALAPGVRIDLPPASGAVPHPFTVAEVTSASYVAAIGELPYRLDPASSFRYADLADGQGGFATIDYGEPGAAPTVYVGHQVALPELHLIGGEPATKTAPAISSQRLACPTCNAPIELKLPGQSLSVTCTSCNAVLGVDSHAVQVVAAQATRPSHAIELGAVGTFPEGSLTVVGFVERSACIEDVWYPFEEYLLHEPSVGFRWLICSDGHWSYVQPIAAGAVEIGVGNASYDGVKFARFQSAPLRVDAVLGELYWRVQVGETVQGEDYIAPPAMVNRETTSAEENWSLSTYMTQDEVSAAFGGKVDVRFVSGVAPNQVDRAATATSTLSWGFVALLIAGIAADAVTNTSVKLKDTIAVPVTKSTPDPIASTTYVPPTYTPTMPELSIPTIDLGLGSGSSGSADAVTGAGGGAGSGSATDGAGSGSSSAPESRAFFSEPFHLDAGKNVELAFRASLNNEWTYVAADLVNVATGQVVSVDAELSYYFGYDDGDSWSEGNQSHDEVIGPQPAGDYMLRLEAEHGGATAFKGTDTPVSVEVRQGVWRGRYLLWACLILGLPLFFLGIHSWSFERKRWDNSTEGNDGTVHGPRSPAIWLVIIIGGMFVLLWKLISGILSSSSSSDD